MKKIFLALAMVMIVTTGAFSQVSLGVSVAQYSEGAIPLLEAWENVTGDSDVEAMLFWGGFGEIAFGKLGFGLSFNVWDLQDNDVPELDTWLYDANIYAINHLFGARAFIDPFIQVGFGIYAFDQKNSEFKSDYLTSMSGGPEDPIAGSGYWDVGAGLGLNIGSIGIFVRGMYTFLLDGYLEGTNWDGNPYDIYPIDFVIDQWGNFKWTFGAKLIL
jgi:hypothetical protein